MDDLAALLTAWVELDQAAQKRRPAAVAGSPSTVVNHSDSFVAKRVKRQLGVVLSDEEVKELREVPAGVRNLRSRN